MSIDKRVNYDVQGGVKNYLGKQKEVTAPLKWQSSPDHPKTELAYITEAEKDLLVKSDLHGSLKGGVNRGPSGIMSLNGWGSKDAAGNEVGMSGAATSAAESGGGSGRDRRELESYISSPAPNPSDVSNDAELGITRNIPTELPQDIKDYRNAFIAAGGGQRVNPGFFDSRYTVSPQEIASAKEYMNRTQFNPQTGKNELVNPYAKGAFRKTHGGGLMGFIRGGGILGNLIRGIGRSFGLGKKYNEPTYDMSKYNYLTMGGKPPEGFGVPTQQGDYDVLGNKINEITGEITSPDGTSLGFLPGYPGSDSGGITTIPTVDDNYTQNVVETINETVDDNIPDEDLLLRYLGADSTLNPEAAGVNSVADLRNLQLERAKNIFTT